MNQEQNRGACGQSLGLGATLGEHEGDEVTEVQRLGRGPPPRVQVELLPLKSLTARRNSSAPLPRRKEKLEKNVFCWCVSTNGRRRGPGGRRRAAGGCEARDAVDERGVAALAPELVHELVVVGAALPRRAPTPPTGSPPAPPPSRHSPPAPKPP